MKIFNKPDWSENKDKNGETVSVNVPGFGIVPVIKFSWVEYMTCPICGEATSHNVVETKQGDYNQCRKCGNIQ